VYQQLNRDTCVLSSAASAFQYFNDIQAHDIVKRNILSSVQQLDRFEFLEEMLKSRKLQYVEERKKKFNLFTDISCYPTIIGLRGKDGSSNHAVTVVGVFVFDSNVPYAQKLSLNFLDWCCSSDTCKTTFDYVDFALRCYHSNPRKEWLVCEGCQNRSGCWLKL